MTAASFYRAIYMTLWRMQESFDLRRHRAASNDNWSPWSAA